MRRRYRFPYEDVARLITDAQEGVELFGLGSERTWSRHKKKAREDGYFTVDWATAKLLQEELGLSPLEDQPIRADPTGATRAPAERPAPSMSDGNHDGEGQVVVLPQPQAEDAVTDLQNGQLLLLQEVRELRDQLAALVIEHRKTVDRIVLLEDASASRSARRRTR